MKLAGDNYGSKGISRSTFPIAYGTVPWNGIAVSYFCGQKNGKSMPNGNIFYFCNVFEDSVSFGVAVEKNRQILATGHTDRYVRNRRTLFSFSVLRGVWRCLFHLKGGRGALFSVWNVTL